MTRRGTFDPGEIIEKWRAAYLSANGCEPPYEVSYERGWFALRQGSIVTRYRRFDIEMMTSALKARCARHAESDESHD